MRLIDDTDGAVAFVQTPMNTSNREIECNQVELELQKMKTQMIMNEN